VTNCFLCTFKSHLLTYGQSSKRLCKLHVLLHRLLTSAFLLCVYVLAANASVTKADVDHPVVTPSPAKHPRTSLRGDNTPCGSDVSNGPTDSKSKGKAPAKGGVGKSKGKQKGRAAGEVDDNKEDDGQVTQVERRAARVVAEDSLKYTADTMRCPLPGCDSKGTDVDNNLY